MSWSGVILVVAGALLLANNFGLLHWGWMQQWWPLFLIVLGVWSILRPGRGQRRGAGAEPTVRTPADTDPRP